MPKRTDIKKIMIIGSGPIIIGQACEFDYSGTQACKSLRSEGYEVVLVNSNPATIMTDPEIANRTYIEPLSKELSRSDHRRRAPRRAAPTVGGQTGLNLAVELAESGILEKYGVKLIGASLDAIRSCRRPPAFQGRLPQDWPGSSRIRGGHRNSGSDPLCRPARLSRGDSPVVHSGRHGRLDCVQP